MYRGELVKKMKEILSENLNMKVTAKESTAILDELEELIQDAIVENKINFAGMTLGTAVTKEKRVFINPNKPELGMRLRKESRKLSVKAGTILRERISKIKK